jgi:ABC-2 type transport system ATP-binding protein
MQTSITAPARTSAQPLENHVTTRAEPAPLTLSIEGIGKRYGRDAWGLRDLSLQLSPGVVGLLGPNGAGKSTLMRILATITKPTTGRVLWNGTDISRSPDVLRATLGYLPQDFGVYPNLNALEFLTYMAAIKGLDGRAARRRIDELLQLVNLTDARTRRLGGYSGGMKQRVGIAQALLNDPQLLIVDEPTAGLDPEERARFRNLLSELSGERIVILSTHIVSDVEATATSIALIRNGQLQCHAAPETLLHALDGQVWEWIVASTDLPALTQQYRFSSQVRRSDGVHVRAVVRTQPSPDAALVAPNLEDVYLSVIASAAAQHQNGGAR